MDISAGPDRVDVYDPIHDKWCENCGKIIDTDYHNRVHTVQLDDVGLHVDVSYDVLKKENCCASA